MRSAVVVYKNESVLESLKMALAGDYVVRAAKHAADSIEPILRGQADLAVIEAEPETPESLEDVTAIARLDRRVPIIVIATSAHSAFAQEAIRAGATEVLGKPFDRAELLAAIAKIERLAGYAGNLVETTPGFPPPPQPPTGPSAKHLVQSLSGLIRGALSPGRLAEAFVDAARDLFAPSKVAVFLINRSLTKYLCIAADRCSEEIRSQLQIKRTDAMVAWLVRHSRILVEDILAAGPASAGSYEVLRSLYSLGGRIAVPLLGTRRMVGFAILGNKLTPAAYTPEELELLALLGSLSGPAFEQALEREWSQPAGPDAAEIMRLGAGVIRVDTDGRVQSLNQRAADYLGVSPDQAEGKPVSALNTDLVKHIRTCLDDRTPAYAELMSSDNGRRLHANCFPVDSGAGGDQRGAVVLLVESVQAPSTGAVPEADLKAFWSNLSTRLAHEVKNPLVAIKTFTQLLPERYGEEAFRNQFFKVVSGEVDRLNTVTEQLVRFAHPPQSTLAAVALRPVVELAIAELDEEVRLAKARLSIDIPRTFPHILADAAALKEALTYVLSNSLDASADSDSKEIRIGAETIPARRRIRLTVEDHGRGISKEDLPEVFTPFFTTKIRGIGLGLPIAKRIIEEQGGEISIESREGEGTRVHMSLQAAESSAGAAAASAEA